MVIWGRNGIRMIIVHPRAETA
ncbi:hypothetical protein [Sphingobacterium sp.]